METAIQEKPSISEEKTAKAALKTFFNIATVWKLSTKEQKTLLGLQADSTFFKYKKGDVKTLPRDTLERVSYILGIYKDLQILLPDEEAADQWVKKPNTAPFFGGQSALNRMLSGNVADLYIVRKYLDAERGGWA